jgi:heptosyltransferase-2
MPNAKILVIRGGALGDFILTIPVLAALRRHFPGHSLEVLAHSRLAPLAAAAGLAGSVHSIDSPRLAALFAPNGSWPGEITDYFSQFDWIISYLYDPEKVFQSNLARCSDARFIAGPHRPDESAGLHATQALLRPLELLGISNADAVPALKLPAVANRLSPAKWLAAHPGSGSARKNWPEQNWLEWSRRLVDQTRLNLLLVGGEAEGDRLMRLAARLPPGRTRVAQDWPLVQLAGCMQECAAFIGHDSGITHLAAALGLPGLVLWADTNQVVWRPQSHKMKLLRSRQGLDQLKVETVLAMLQDLLENPQCGKPTTGGRASTRDVT